MGFWGLIFSLAIVSEPRELDPYVVLEKPSNASFDDLFESALHLFAVYENRAKSGGVTSSIDEVFIAITTVGDPEERADHDLKHTPPELRIKSYAPKPGWPDILNDLRRRHALVKEAGPVITNVDERLKDMPEIVQGHGPAQIPRPRESEQRCSFLARVLGWIGLGPDLD